MFIPRKTKHGGLSHRLLHGHPDLLEERAERDDAHVHAALLAAPHLVVQVVDHVASVSSCSAVSGLNCHS